MKLQLRSLYFKSLTCGIVWSDSNNPLLSVGLPDLKKRIYTLTNKIRQCQKAGKHLFVHQGRLNNSIKLSQDCVFPAILYS